MENLSKSPTKKNTVKTYIQRRDGANLETVDEFSSTREARAMLREYQFADPSARYYMSSRPCKAWREK